MTRRPIDQIIERLSEFITYTWPLIYAALLTALLHHALERLQARQRIQEESHHIEAPRPVVFDPRLKRFRRFETGDELFFSVEEGESGVGLDVEREEFENVNGESDSGNASFSTDSIGFAESSSSISSSIQLVEAQLRSTMQLIEESTKDLLLEKECLSICKELYSIFK